MKFLRKIFPAAEWLAEYDKGELQGDLSAGLTVGVMLIPQSMAYAMLAGVDPIYGLYAGLVPLLLYSLLGTARHLAIGPVTVDMLIVGAGVGAVAGAGEHLEYVILVAAMTGIIEIGMGLLGFGFMVNFLSRPVIAGFMTAAPLIIASNQLGNLMGVELVESQYVHDQVLAAIRHFDAAYGPALAIGIAGIAVLWLLQAFKPRWPAALIWVVGATLVSWWFGLGPAGLDTVGQVPEGLPPFELQAWNLEAVQDLAPTALTLALVQFMYVMSLGQAFASEHGYSIDANRELFAIGSANVAGSFFQSVPVSGSFSRSAVNNRSGAKTPLANVVAAVLVGLTLLFLTPLFRFLPISGLAAIIVVACFGMIDVSELKYLLETRWLDGAVALITFAATLVIGIQEGILIGVGTSILVVLYDLSQPNVVELGHVPGTQEFRDVQRNPEAERISDIHMIRIDSRFSFANAKVLKEELLEETDEGSVRALVIDTSGVNDLDTTAVQALIEVVEEVSDRDIELYVAGAKGPLRDVMRRSGLQELIGEGNFYLNAHLAVSDILEEWEEEEEYAPADQKQRREEMTEARKRLEEERERIEQERRSMDEERRRLQQELSQHEGQRQQLSDERRRLREELRRVQKRRDRRRSSDREAEAGTRGNLEQRQRELEERREELDREKDELEERRAELDTRSEELEDAAELTRRAVDSDEMVDRREALESDIEEHVAERGKLEEAREQLEEELERAERRRQKLREERHKMKEQKEEMREEKEELREERKRLEEARREVGKADDEPVDGADEGSGSEAEDAEEPDETTS